jgi:hypothetical protein
MWASESIPGAVTALACGPGSCAEGSGGRSRETTSTTTVVRHKVRAALDRVR